MKGKFIVFEGLDGSGSSTQAKKLADWLENKGKKVLLTKEPTSNIIGGIVRGQLSHDWRASPECLQLLFAADRAHHLEKEIMPALHQGAIVISDRYFFSTFAYGQAEGLDLNWLLAINKLFPVPDATILLKVSPKMCLKRMQRTRFDLELFENKKKLCQVWSYYEKLARKFRNCHIINGEKDPEVISQEIRRMARRLVPNV